MLVLVSILSHAAPVDQGVQLQVQPSAFDFVEQELTREPFELGPYSINTAYDCYYDLSVDNFNLSVEIESVDVTLGDGSIDIDVQLGTVRGEEIFVAGVSGYFDICLDFDTTVQYVEITEGRLQGTLRAVDKGDGVALEFVGSPFVSGDFDSEINWFPDDLVWAFASDYVLEAAGGYLVDLIPGVLEEPFDAVFDSPIGSFPVSVAIDELASSSQGLYASADIDLGGEGSDNGPTLDLGPSGDSQLAIGVTEGLVKDVVSVAWEGGLLEDGTDSIEDLISELLSTLDLPDDVDTTLSLGDLPEISIQEEAITLKLPEASLEAWDGDEKLLGMVLDLEAVLEPKIDPASGAILMSAYDMGIEVVELDAEHLVKDEEGEKNLSSFLQGWVAEVVTGSLDNTPLLSSVFDTFGYVIRLDEVGLQDGGAATWISLFNADDPEVDLEAPDTEASVDTDEGTASMEGSDDRDGDLLFSWRFDGGSWSFWSDETTVSIPDDLEKGAHIFEARARDEWQNEDPSPATVSFEIDPSAKKGKNDKKKGCGCDSAPGAPSLALLFGLVALSRRRAMSV